MALVCYECGEANEEDALLCLSCDGVILTSGVTRPVFAAAVARAPDDLPYPWELLGRWPAGSVVALDGGPGAGKSSLCALLRPAAWVTNEETSTQAQEALRRLQGAEGEGWPDAPLIVPCAGLYGLLDALDQLYDGLAVFDSVTGVGHPHEQLEAMQAIVEWSRAGPGRRALAVLQHTQAGGAAGPRKIAHLAQTEASILLEDEGRRLLNLRKHRHGGLSSRYFELGADGVRAPDFPHVYSVEGHPGAYRLVPYPTRGAKWDGRFRGLEDNEATLPLRTASAAVQAPYGRGYREPRDAEARRAFAAAHGLAWLDRQGRHAAPNTRRSDG